MSCLKRSEPGLILENMSCTISDCFQSTYFCCLQRISEWKRIRYSMNLLFTMVVASIATDEYFSSVYKRCRNLS